MFENYKCDMFVLSAQRTNFLKVQMWTNTFKCTQETNNFFEIVHKQGVNQ